MYAYRPSLIAGLPYEIAGSTSHAELAIPYGNSRNKDGHDVQYPSGSKHNKNITDMENTWLWQMSNLGIEYKIVPCLALLLDERNIQLWQS